MNDSTADAPVSPGNPTRPAHRRLAILGALALVGSGAVALGVAPAAGAATPASQTWTVPGSYDFVAPDAVGALTITAEGGEGADGGNDAYGTIAEGGLGGRMTATLDVAAGTVLHVNVGGAGVGETGGANGGGSAPASTLAGGGGGASDVRLGGTGLNDRIVVAGGGGGGARRAPGGDAGDGGAGGGTAGGNADDSDWMGDAGLGGGAGGLSAGGAGGAAVSGVAGNDGVFGRGGDSPDGCEEAGAGGGGWFGGGSGSPGCWNSGGGGGGGSNYSAPSMSGAVSLNGVHVGDGTVTITWVAADPPPTTTPPTTTPPAPSTPPSTTTPPPAPRFVCPSHAIRVTWLNLWAVNPLRFFCGYRLSWLRNRRVVVPYLIPRGWRWKWTVNPHHR